MADAHRSSTDKATVLGSALPGPRWSSHDSLINSSDYHQKDASNFLFIDGLPGDCSRREVSHLFRPFYGFKEIRLVHKEPKDREEKPRVLCFVEFLDAKCASSALEVLQGYKFDNKKPDSRALRIHFAKFPFRLPFAGNEQHLPVSK